MAHQPGGGSIEVGELHSAMIERLRTERVLHTPAVEAALRSVQRHRYIDGATLETSYADVAVSVKTDEAGVAISAASQPTIVAAMLELCLPKPGQRILEIGTGTGYNAALLACLVGPTGLVVTIELEDDLAAAAQARLRADGFDAVRVVVGDGAAGYPNAAPYDRIMVTTGAAGVASAWVAQLRDGGRLVVPVVDSGGVGTIRCLVRQGSEIEDVETIPCGFLPMRS